MEQELCSCSSHLENWSASYIPNEYVLSLLKVGHIGGQGELGELPSLTIGPDGEVMVADSKILVYSEEGVMVSILPLYDCGICEVDVTQF